MTKLSFVSLFGAFLIVSIGGCSMFGSKPADNSSPAMRDALEVPPDLARPAGNDDLLAGTAAKGANADSSNAAGATRTATANVTSTPAAAAPAPAAARVRLERDGAQRWLVVQDTPDHVWAAARSYMLRNNYKLTVDNPKTGLLETDWLDRPVQFSNPLGRIIASLSSTGLRDRFRVRVEPGRVAGTTEVYVSHQGLEQVVKDANSNLNVTETMWQPRASDPQMEADLLDKLMVDFGLDSQQAKNELASASTPRAQIAKNVLFLPQQDLDSAWRRVGQALDRSGVAIEDLDRNAGIYYVHYVSGVAKKESGLFGFLGSGNGSDADRKDDTSLDRFQVALKTQADGTNVTVRNVKGEVEDSTAGARLLELLYQQLR
jgi:outer membrane protein assembly factor BamC